MDLGIFSIMGTISISYYSFDIYIIYIIFLCMEIITKGWPKGEQIFLDEITCTYLQEVDCTEDRNGEPQSIILSSRDGGGGKFINIKTNGWSISGDNLEEDLIPLIEDFKHRMNDVSFISNSRPPREEILERSNS